MFISLKDSSVLKNLTKNTSKEEVKQKIDSPFKFLLSSQENLLEPSNNSKNNNKLSVSISFITQKSANQFLEKNSLTPLMKPDSEKINSNSLAQLVKLTPFNITEKKIPTLKNIDFKIKGDKNQEVRNTIFEVLKDVFADAHKNTLVNNKNLTPENTSILNDTVVTTDKNILSDKNPLKLEVYKAINSVFSFIKNESPKGFTDQGHLTVSINTNKNSIDKSINNGSFLNEDTLKQSILGNSNLIISELAYKYKNISKEAKNNNKISDFDSLYKDNNILSTNELLPFVNSNINKKNLSKSNLDIPTETVDNNCLEYSVDTNNHETIDPSINKPIDLFDKKANKVELFFDHILDSLSSFISIKDSDLESIPELNLNSTNIVNDVFDVLKEVFEDKNIKVSTNELDNELDVELPYSLEKDDLFEFKEVFFELGKSVNTLKNSSKDNDKPLKVDLKRLETGIKKLDSLFIKEELKNNNSSLELKPSKIKAISNNSFEIPKINKNIFDAMVQGLNKSIKNNSNISSLDVKLIKNIFTETFKDNKFDFSLNAQTKVISINSKLDDNTLVSSLLNKKPELPAESFENKSKITNISNIVPKLDDNTLVSSLLNKKPEGDTESSKNKPKITEIKPKLDFTNQVTISKINNILNTNPKKNILKNIESEPVNNLTKNTFTLDIKPKIAEVKPKLDFTNQVTISKINNILDPNKQSTSVNEKTEVKHNIKYNNQEKNIINKKVEQSSVYDEKSKTNYNSTLVNINDAKLEKTTDYGLDKKKIVKKGGIDDSNLMNDTLLNTFEPTKNEIEDFLISNVSAKNLNNDSLKSELNQEFNTNKNNNIPSELKNIDYNKFDDMVELFKNYFDSLAMTKKPSESKISSLATISLLKSEIKNHNNIEDVVKFPVDLKEFSLIQKLKPELIKEFKNINIEGISSNETNLEEISFITEKIIDNPKPKLEKSAKNEFYDLDKYKDTSNESPKGGPVSIKSKASFGNIKDVLTSQQATRYFDTNKITQISKKQNIKTTDNNNILPQMINSSELIKYINNGTPIHFSQIPDVIKDITVNYVSTEPIAISLTLKPFNMGEVEVTFKLNEERMMSINFETSSLASQKIIQSYFQSIKEIVKDNSLVLHELTANTMQMNGKPIQEKSRSSFNNSSSNKDESEKGSFSSVRKRNKKRSSDDGDKEEIRVDI